MKFLSEKSTTIFYFLAVSALVSILAIFYQNTQKVKLTSNIVEHTQEVLRQSDKVLLDILNIETGFRGFLISGNDSFLKPFNDASQSINNDIEELGKITKENPKQQLRIIALKKGAEDRMAFTLKYIDAVKHNKLKETEKTAVIEEGDYLTHKIRDIVVEINAEEFSLLKYRKSENDASNRYSEMLFILFLVLVIVSTVLVIISIINQKNKRKYAEGIRQSAELFSNLFNSNPASISINQLSDGKIINVNNSFLELFGFSNTAEVIGKTFAELNVFIDPTYGEEIVKLLKENKIVKDFETNIKTRLGEVKWTSASVMFLEVENSPCLFFVSIDITKRKKAEDELRTVISELEASTDFVKLSSQYSLSLIEASLDPLVTINTEGKITDMNQAFVNTTGITRERLKGSNFFDYFTNPQMAREVYQEVFAKGSLADSPLTVRHLSGKLTDVLFNGSVYRDDMGNVLGVVIVARDVTAQKLLSKYSLSLIEASLDPLVTINTEGKITDMNEAFVNSTGIVREKLKGTDFFDYFTQPQMAREVYQEVFAKGSVADSPLTLRHVGGKLTDVLFNGSVYKDDRGNVLGVVIVARDVTAQKLLSKYSLSLIEASLDPLVTINTEGKITDMNEAFVKSIGIVREKLKGTDFFDYFTQPQMAREVYQEVFAKGSVADSPLTLRHVGGKLTDVLFNGSVYKDDRGNVLGVVFVARDVTAQKLLSKYSLSLIEASFDPLVTINTHGKITDMNEAFVNKTGITREKLKGTDFFDYFTQPQMAREVYQEVFAKGSVADSPLTLRHVGGELTDVLFNGSVYKDDRGNVLGVVIVARDVTAQKQASQYARSLIEASLDPLFTISPAGKITDMNKASVDITEVSREMLIGTDFFEYFTESDKAREIYKKVFADGFVADFPLTILDGKLTSVLFNGSVYKDQYDNVLGAVVVARDITENKRFEKELIEAKVFAELAAVIAEDAKAIAEESTTKAENAARIAEDAVKAKQQFLSNMSHEIRTPMNAIIGFTKVVLKTNLTEKQKEYLNAIKMSGDSLIVLINDILDLAKVDAGKMKFEQSPFRMSASISAMVHVFETKIQEKNLKLIKEYDSKIPNVLAGDPVRLHQIILNLISNAVKFTKEGEIKVRVQLLEEDEKNAIIKFSVIDTGIGIGVDKIKNIFENFQQATSETSRLYGGTGLGLAISKQLVESQGGTITVNSKLGKGSTFSFILSFQKTENEAELDSETLELEIETGNIKVLVVEDIALNQLLMKTLLDDFGFEHDIAGNGKLAIAQFQKKPYDIVLMDLQMPEMNGFEATDYIRNELNSQIPIIALTADVTTADLQKCKALGMNDYIAKPIDERLLYRKIIELLKNMATIKDQKHHVEEISQPKMDETIPKCIDLTHLISLTKGNKELMMEMIDLYLKQTIPLIGDMKHSISNNDWSSLYQAVHKMIPSFSIMGIDKDYENMAKQAQEYAGSKEHLEALPELVLQLEDICNQACTELEIEYNLIKNKN